MDATIIVATFGSQEWKKRGEETANKTSDRFIESVIQGHSDNGSLAFIRNTLAAQAQSEWLCFLDADDELGAEYFKHLFLSNGDLRAPAVWWKEPDSLSIPVTLSNRDMRVGNPCVIGTLIRKEMFMQIGGFWEEPAYEDWSLFRRAWLLGAKLDHVKDAVYIVNVRPESRNNTVDNPAGLIKSITRSHDKWMRDRV